MLTTSFPPHVTALVQAAVVTDELNKVIRGGSLIVGALNRRDVLILHVAGAVVANHFDNDAPAYCCSVLGQLSA